MKVQALTSCRCISITLLWETQRPLLLTYSESSVRANRKVASPSLKDPKSSGLDRRRPPGMFRRFTTCPKRFRNVCPEKGHNSELFGNPSKARVMRATFCSLVLGSPAPGFRLVDPDEDMLLRAQTVGRENQVSSLCFRSFPYAEEATQAESENRSFSQPSPAKAGGQDSNQNNGWHGNMVGRRFLGQPHEGQVPCHCLRKAGFRAVTALMVS